MPAAGTTGAGSSSGTVAGDHEQSPDTQAPWRANSSHRDLPNWAARLCGQPGEVLRKCEHHVIAETTRADFSHRVCTLHDATDMDGSTFTARALEAYRDLLTGIARRRIFRMWNFIPGIQRGDCTDQDRYMRFNAARFEAFGSQPHAEHPYPPASGVGHEGQDLVLHLMTGDITVETLDNPRQTLPQDYSKAWGHLPPVFTRSALIHGMGPSPLLIVSGTASVRGEATMFEDDVDRQLDETIKNLEELLRLASPEARSPKLDSMLVYVSERKHLDRLRSRITSELADENTDIEFRLGRLCRRSLLVEIEGTRRLEGAGS